MVDLAFPDIGYVFIDLDGESLNSAPYVLFFAGAGQKINNILCGTCGERLHLVHL